MSISDLYLKPQCIFSRVDLYTARSAILHALQEVLPDLEGVLLDVGCGYQPYRPILTAPPSRVSTYVGLDFANSGYAPPDLEWDGTVIPLPDASIDTAIATEVLEHCPEPGLLLGEVYRVLKPGGLLFLTVPFLWPIHDAPHDEYRYTPYSLGRHLETAGYHEVKLKPLGCWDASLAQMLGLWVRRRPMQRYARAVLSRLAVPVISYLLRRDRAMAFHDGVMITGLSGTARKPKA